MAQQLVQLMKTIENDSVVASALYWRQFQLIFALFNRLNYKLFH